MSRVKEDILANLQRMLALQHRCDVSLTWRAAAASTSHWDLHSHSYLAQRWNVAVVVAGGLVYALTVVSWYTHIGKWLVNDKSGVCGEERKKESRRTGLELCVGALGAGRAVAVLRAGRGCCVHRKPSQWQVTRARRRQQQPRRRPRAVGSVLS